MEEKKKDATGRATGKTTSWANLKQICAWLIILKSLISKPEASLKHGPFFFAFLRNFSYQAVGCATFTTSTDDSSAIYRSCFSEGYFSYNFQVGKDVCFKVWSEYLQLTSQFFFLPKQICALRRGKNHICAISSLDAVSSDGKPSLGCVCLSSDINIFFPQISDFFP